MDDLGNRAEDASIAASLGAQQLPVKLEGRCREVEHELNRTVQVIVVTSFDKFEKSRITQIYNNHNNICCNSNLFR